MSENTIERDEQRGEVMSDIKLVSKDITRTHVRTGEEILATLKEMLVTRLEEDLDLTNPDDLDIYNKSRALHEYIDKTLREAEHEQEVRKKTLPTRGPR